MTPFFYWFQTSVRLCTSGPELLGHKNFLCKIGLILKLREVKIGSSMRKIDLFKNLTYLSKLFSKIYEKK